MLKLLARLFGHGFTPLEALVLAAVRAHLPHDQVRAWDAQVAAINKVQRLPQGSEVNFYVMKGGRASVGALPPLSEAPGETLFAQLSAAPLRGAALQKVDVWLVDGQLFSLEFCPGSGYWEEALSQSLLTVDDLTCTVLPASPPSDASAS